jgi:hypothetical protein
MSPLSVEVKEFLPNFATAKVLGRGRHGCTRKFGILCKYRYYDPAEV